MRSVQGRADSERNVESFRGSSRVVSLGARFSVAGILFLLLVMVISGLGASVLSPVASNHAGAVPAVPHVASPAASRPTCPLLCNNPPAASVSSHPLITAVGGLYLAGYNTSKILWLGQSENATITWNGTTVIAATVNITYGAAAGLGIPSAAGGCAAVGDWCPANNASQGMNMLWGYGYQNVTFSPSSATGTYTLWVWINATCNPTPTSWAPCKAVGKLTVIVEADPSSAVTSTPGLTLTGPFVFPLSFTLTTASAHDLWQAQAVIVIYSQSTNIYGTTSTWIWSEPNDPALDVGFAETGSPLTSPYSYTLTLADVALQPGEGNLPAGYYWVGVQLEDANGTIYESYLANSVGFAITQLSVGPAAGSVFTAGHPITVSWATEGLLGQTDVNFTVGFPVSGNQVLNEYQAGGYSAGSELIVPTLPGTYYVNLSLASPSTPTVANVSTWFTVTVQAPPSCPGGYVSGGTCYENITKVQTDNWDNSTWINTTVFTNTTGASSTKIDGMGANALGAILIVVGILVGGIVGIMAGKMMFGRKMGGSGDMGSDDMGSMSSSSSGTSSTEKKDEFS